MRVPLTSILNALEMMQLGLDGPLSQEAQTSLGHIADDMTRLRSAAESLLRLVRITEYTARPRPTDLVSLLGKLPPQPPRTLHIAPDKPLPAVRADSELLFEVLSLAVQYVASVAEAGAIPVSADQQEEKVVIQVGAWPAAPGPLPDAAIRDEQAIWLLTCRRGAQKLGADFEVAGDAQGAFAVRFSLKEESAAEKA